MKNDWVLKNIQLADALVSHGSVGEFLKFYYTQTKKHSPSVSYENIAKKMGVSKSLVVGIFHGKKSITLKTLPLMIDALKLPAPLASFFSTLVSLEEGHQHEKLKLLEKQREIFLDSLKESVNIDFRLHSTDFPILYAALGEHGTGSTIEEMIRRTKWSEEKITFVLRELELKKLVKRINQSHWAGTKLFLTTISSNPDGWLANFYQESLKRHESIISQNFFSKEHLSYTLAFCIDEVNFAKMNIELKDAINLVVNKYHDGNGDKIVGLVLGTHKI